MSALELQISGYSLEAVIARIDDRVVYRARRQSDGAAVALETLNLHYPSREQVATLQRDGTVSQRLQHITGVRPIHELRTHGSGNIALIGDLYESSLRAQLARSNGSGLPLAMVLNVVDAVVTILADLHEADIVHKSLMPEHILLGASHSQVVLGGFALASELDQERQASTSSKSLQGPLPYMSPEQTGRMNRDVDYRSDFYSLGVVFYELLTGKLPFEADDSLAWVHCHISRIPIPPVEVQPSIPAVVSDVVMKLLAKSPEQRYQSAQGLGRDLKQILKAVTAQKPVPNFILGQYDSLQKFLIPQTLYGRDQELKQLFDLFEDAAVGANRFCFVSGFSGVGKSALVNELDRPAVRERGFLVQGKFDQFQQNTAFSALIASFRSLIQQVLAMPAEQVAKWQQRLSMALAPNAQLVIDLVPEFALLVGEQPQVISLSPSEERNRLQLTLIAFVKCFADRGHPLILFLDDLQWSDKPTLELLHRLALASDVQHLLVIGAYRDNEVNAGHPLRLLLEDLRPQTVLAEMEIGTLSSDSVAELVAGAMNRSKFDVQELSEMLFNKALGNPFFTNELLRQLHKDGGIVAEANSGRWTWVKDSAPLADFSSDVLEFMVANLRQLSPETQQVLQLAACIGGTFDLHTLSAIYKHSVAETATALMPALKQQSVLPLNSDYRLVDESGEAVLFNPNYKFQHDRVQQAAYALIVVQKLREVHLSVGRLMMQHLGGEVPDDRLIEVVGHLNEGQSLISNDDEIQQLLRLNLRAGIRAKRAAAYEAALAYLHKAHALLPEQPWQTIPELMRSLASEIQQCAYLTGHIDEAEQWIALQLQHATSPLERANILATRTRQYATLGRMEDSIEAAIEGLATVGVEFSRNPTAADIEQQQQRILENLNGRRIEDLVDAPELIDENILIAIRLLMEIFAAAFLSGSGRLFPYLVLQSANLSLKHGNCPESAFSYASYGMLLCGELDEPALGYEYGKLGLAINERFDDLSLKARVIYVYAMFVHHWSQPWQTLTDWFKKGIDAGYQSGDLLYLAYSAQDCVIWDPTLDLDTAQQLHADNMVIVRDCAYQDSFDSGSLFLQLQRNMLGYTDGLFTLSESQFDANACLAGMRQRQFMTGIANYHIYNAEVAVLYADFDAALVHIREQDRLIKSAMSLPQLVRFYLLANVTLAEQYPSLSTAEQADCLHRLQQDAQRMRRWADNCEANFRHLQYLMEAEIAKLQHQYEQVLPQYDRAIDQARQGGFLRDEAFAYERAARFLIAQGRPRSAEGYLRGAYRLYDRWGAVRKVELLEQEFPLLQEMLLASINSSQSQQRDLDLASIMKASREISGEIVLDQLLEKIMQQLLENAGAQWGCVIVNEEQQLRVVRQNMPAELAAHQGFSLSATIADASERRYPLPVSLVGRVLHSGEAVVYNHAVTHDDLSHDAYIAECKPLSVLCVPFRRNRFDAVLYMENNLATGVFTNDRVEVIKLLAAQASVAIENARLYETVQEYTRNLEQKVQERTAELESLNHELKRLADRDGLTGVANRRAGDTHLDNVWLQTLEAQQPLSVIMLDADHFKAYNDYYGHQDGDDCLRKLAAIISKLLRREADMVMRYGGEEFMLILPFTNNAGAMALSEKIRMAVLSEAIAHEASKTNSVVTVSIGVATTIPTRDSASSALVGAADEALYRAKKQGRNRSCNADISP